MVTWSEPRGVSLSNIKLRKRLSWAAAALIQARGEVDGEW